MRIIKRSGAEVDFDISKIIAAIYKANAVVGEDDKEITGRSHCKYCRKPVPEHEPCHECGGNPRYGRGRHYERECLRGCKKIHYI